MYHTLEFAGSVTVDLEVAPKQPLERLRIARGARLIAETRPYVVKTATGPVEVADLFFADGTTTRAMPFALFTFVD